jgi:hypothetical protein
MKKYEDGENGGCPTMKNYEKRGKSIDFPAPKKLR